MFVLTSPKMHGFCFLHMHPQELFTSDWILEFQEIAVFLLAAWSVYRSELTALSAWSQTSRTLPSCSCPPFFYKPDQQMLQGADITAIRRSWLPFLPEQEHSACAALKYRSCMMSPPICLCHTVKISVHQLMDFFLSCYIFTASSAHCYCQILLSFPSSALTYLASKEITASFRLLE